MEQNSFIVLLDRFLKGETSPEEEKLLLTRFREPGIKEELFSVYYERWNKSSDLLSTTVQSKMLNAIRQKIQEGEAKQSKGITVWLKKHTALYRYAAIASLLICIAIGANNYIRKSYSTSEQFVMSVDRGQKASIELPDGTQVWLNSDTKLKYDNAYNMSDRSVTLDGEAYFEVAKNKDKKFTVNANGIKVEALGTSFNVKAYTSENQVTTTLVEGCVRVSDSLSQTILNPNERIVYSCKNRFFSKTEVPNAANSALWRNNELAFCGETLEEIAVVLERMYNVKIVFTTQAIKHYSFAGVIKNNSLGNIFEIISLTAPIQYTISDSIIQISESK